MTAKARRRGFTITEMLLVAGIIVLVMAMLLPALASVRRTGHMTKSMSNMRQIGSWMRLYQDANRDQVVPSQFDYSDPSAFLYKGKVRSQAPRLGDLNQGTWTDILWTVYQVGEYPAAVVPLGHDYMFDSPDPDLYAQLGGDVDNPFRSAAPNSRNTTTGDVMRPYGAGAQERGEPGYFAANDFFNARPDRPDIDPALEPSGRWFTMGQVKRPEQSVYVVDSFAGEVINDPGMTYPQDVTAWEAPELEVDFRYNDACLMLFLDGHVNPEGPWLDLIDLDARKIRVTNLTGQ